MSENDDETRNNDRLSRHREALTGTTLRVYRFLYRSGKPNGIREIQRGLELSSASVAQYHVKRLLASGLIRVNKTKEAESDEENRSVEGQSQGYIVDKVVFENMIRLRRSLIPFQVAYAVFFGIAFVILLMLFRPASFDAQYTFSLLIIAIAFAVFLSQAVRALGNNRSI